MVFCLYGFSQSGEINRMTAEAYFVMFAPFGIRLIVLFVVFGIPSGPQRFPRR